LLTPAGRVRILSPMARWLTGASCVALVVCVALASTGVAGAARVMKVDAPTVLQMAGSDVYCTVIKEPSGNAVACFHDPGGPTSKIRKGDAIAAFDQSVAVEPPGTTRPNKTVAQPKHLAGLPANAGGSRHSTVVKLGTGDGAFVKGTHMAVVVEPAKGGGNAI